MTPSKIFTICEKWHKEDHNFHFSAFASEHNDWQDKQSLMFQAVVEDFEHLNDCQEVCCGSPEVDYTTLDNLIKLLKFSDPDVRADIAWAMGQIGGVKARITLAALSQGDDDIGVRTEASRAIRSGAILGNKKS